VTSAITLHIPPNLPRPQLTKISSCPAFFFFNDTATTEIYTLSLHDALPIFPKMEKRPFLLQFSAVAVENCSKRSEEHTSELQSHSALVCRLLLEKKTKEGTWVCAVCRGTKLSSAEER